MKTQKRIIGILLSLALVLGLMPGISLTAYAENNQILYTFTASSAGDELNKREYKFALGSDKCSKITKIEVLIDMEKILEGGW